MSMKNKLSKKSIGQGSLTFFTMLFLVSALWIFSPLGNSVEPIEPFTITEHTEFGFTSNIVTVTITENLGKAQNIDISNIFIDHPLTDKLIYSSLLMNQSFESDIIDLINESQGKYKSIETIYWDVDVTNNETGLNETITYNSTIFFDDIGNEMICDHILADKSCLIEKQGVIATEIKHDFKPMPTIKEKIVINEAKIEQKESGIPLPKNGIIQVRYTVNHPIPFGKIYSEINTTYNKYDIMVCSNTSECTILDPIWYNLTWGLRKPITIEGIGLDIPTDYQLAITIDFDNDMQNGFDDLRFTWLNTTDDTEYEIPYWLQSQTNGSSASGWVKVPIIYNDTTNTTIFMYYKNNTGVISLSNSESVMTLYDNFNDNSYNTSKWTTYSDGGGTAVETGGALVISAGSSHSGGGSYSTTFPKDSYILSAKWKVSIISSGSCEGNDCGANYFSFRHETNYRDTTYYGGQTKHYINNYMFPDENEMRRYDVTDGESGTDLYTTASVLNTYYDIDLIITPDGYKTYKNDVLLYDVSYGTDPTVWTTLSDDIRVEFYNGDYSRTAPITIDDVIVRKYAPTEPTYTFGAEESPNTLPTVTANVSSPDPIYQNNDWLINLTATDPNDGDNLTGYVNLFVNDTLIGLYSAPMTNNTNTLVATLQSGNFSNGDNLTAETWVGDDVSNTSKTNLTITVEDPYPNIEDITWITTSGDTDDTLTYLQVLDYIKVNSTDSVTTPIVTLSIKTPNDVYTITNTTMTQDGDFWNYTTDITLNFNGTWTIEIYSNNTYNLNFTSDTIEVAKTTVSTFDGWFGYFTETIPSTGDITTLITYDYDLIGIQDNWSNFQDNWTIIKSAINNSKEQNVKNALTFTFDGDYSNMTYVNNTKTDISNNLTDLKSSPYTETTAMIIIDINSSNTDTDTYNFINNISQTMASTINNLFPIYVKDYTSASLDTSYTAPFILPYNTYTTESAFINREITYLRDNTTLTRIYYELSNTLKTRSQNYHNNIIHNLEDIPTGTTTEDEFNVADIENDGVVVFNNESTQQLYIFNLSGRINDIWDRTNNIIIEKNTDGNFSITLNAHDVANLLFKLLDRFVFGADYSTLYQVASQENTYFNYTDGTRTASWTVYGANDIKIELWDSSYGLNNQFMIEYGWINSSYVVNYSDYVLVIIADQNGAEINNSIGDLDKTHFYISVADYADTDEWQNTKTTEIENIINTYYTHIFVDGMDSGAMGTDFEIRIKAIADYIRVNYGNKIIFNDYSSYLLVSDYGTADMKESFCSRWNGSVNDPNYYYENISIDVIRANWARTKNKQQLLMAFGDVDDMEKMAYCYAEYLVLYGTANNNTFKYGQPNFQTQREIYTKDVGTQLEATWTESTVNDWNRKFTKGTMHIDTFNHTWSFDDARSTSAELCFDLYNGAGTPSTAGPLRYTINMPNTSFDVSKVYNITYDEVAGGSSGVWDTVCKSINSVDITNDGRYDIRVWCGSADGTSRCTTGFDIGNDLVEGTGVHSWYDSSAPNYPAVEGYGTVYGRDQSNNLTRNWNIYLNMNDTTSTSIDTVYEEINRTVTTNGGIINITLDSSKNYNLTIVDNGTTVDTLIAISAWNGSGFSQIYPIDSDTCSGDNPTFNDTTVNGELFGACTDIGVNSTFVRFTVPHLSEQIIQLEIDGSPPVISDFNLTNDTYEAVDLSENTTGILYAEWNVTDPNLNISTCEMAYRAYDTSGIYYSNWSFINGSLDTSLDVNGWKIETCNFISGNGDNTSIRVNMNLTDDDDWRPGTFNFDHEVLSKDTSIVVFKDTIVKVTFNNVTTTPNTSYIFEFQIDEANILTSIDFVVYACNSSYTTGDPRLSPFCTPTEAVNVGDQYDNLQFYDMHFDSDNSSEFNGIKITETMYGVGTQFAGGSSNKGWDVWATNGQDCGDHYQTSIDAGDTWSNVSGSCGNHHLHYFNGFQGEFKIIINDTLGNSATITEIDLMGKILNHEPELTLRTDEIQGGFPTIYSDANITETGTLWINVTVSDPDQDNLNCSFYLLNDDLSLNRTILNNFELNASFGTCYYVWDTSLEADGEYYVKVNVTDGVLVSSDILISVMRLDNNPPNIVINLPTSESNIDHTPTINITANENIELIYNIDGGSNITACASCIGYQSNLSYLGTGSHTLVVYGIDQINLTDSANRTFAIFDIDQGSPGNNFIEAILEDKIIPLSENVSVNISFLDRVLVSTKKICLDKEVISQTRVLVAIGEDNIPIYQIKTEVECVKYLEFKMLHLFYLFSGVVSLLVFYFILNVLGSQMLTMNLKRKQLNLPFRN